MTGLVLDRARIRKLFDLRSDVYASRGGTFDVDPYETFHRLRETGPVHQGTPHEELGWTGEVFFQGLPYPQRPHFSAYDFETCSTVLKDDRHFVPSVPPLPGEPPLLDAAILYMNGKQHRNYRTLVQPSFVPARAMWWLDNWIRDLVQQLIESFAGATTADLNVEFCAPIPLLTITGSFGITVEEALDVRAAVTSDGQDSTTLARVLAPIIAARRTEPGDDLITVLVQAELADEDGVVHRLRDQEVLAFALLLLAAGSGTTWKQMGITLTALLQRPEVLQAVKEDRSKLRPAIEESLRWMPTDPIFSRHVTRDVDFHGVHLPAGSVLHMCLGAANRDPARWDRPDEYDIYRPSRPSFAFGSGAHVCLGMHVARAEMTVGIGALLDRLPNLRLDPDAEPPRFIGMYERGATEIPVVFG
jgi:cytochrome P450